MTKILTQQVFQLVAPHCQKINKCQSDSILKNVELLERLRDGNLTEEDASILMGLHTIHRHYDSQFQKHVLKIPKQCLYMQIMPPKMIKLQ